MVCSFAAAAYNVLIRTTFSAFDWASLPSDSLIVDVGGGLGPATLKLVNAFPHLKYLIQDQQSVVDASPDVSLVFIDLS